MIAALTVAGVGLLCVCASRAAAPVTCGVAIDVPLMVLVAVVDVYHDDVMLEPGANRSTHGPMFENDERASVEVVDPTVSAFGTRDGEPLHALAPLSLPAATA